MLKYEIWFLFSMNKILYFCKILSDNYYVKKQHETHSWSFLAPFQPLYLKNNNS